MGRQGNIKLRLTLENLIFYELNGEFYIRTKPVTVKQTKATKQKSKLFGKASTIAKSVKNCLVNTIPCPADRDMQTRLRIAVLKYLNAQQTLTGFEFNDESGITERLKVKITVMQVTANVYTVQLPAFIPVETITAPAYTKRLVIKFAAVAINLNTANIECYDEQQLAILYGNNTIPEQQVIFNLNGTGNAMILIIAALQYYKTNDNTGAVNNKRWLPAGIIWMGKEKQGRAV